MSLSAPVLSAATLREGVLVCDAPAEGRSINLTIRTGCRGIGGASQTPNQGNRTKPLPCS